MSSSRNCKDRLAFATVWQPCVRSMEPVFKCLFLNDKGGIIKKCQKRGAVCLSIINIPYRCKTTLNCVQTLFVLICIIEYYMLYLSVYWEPHYVSGGSIFYNIPSHDSWVFILATVHVQTYFVSLKFQIICGQILTGVHNDRIHHSLPDMRRPSLRFSLRSPRLRRL